MMMMKKKDNARKVTCKDETVVVKQEPQMDRKVDWVGKTAAARGSEFQMPLHYPRYRREEYEKMEEWKVDMVLREYGLSFDGTLHDKRSFAIGAFLWPNQF